MRKPKAKLKRSTLQVVDLPIDDLIPDEDNPNVQDEATFDLLVEELRENEFDEPIQVRKHPTEKGKYQISAGHHRVKALRVLGRTTVPSIIKDYTDRDQKISLVKRNQLRGEFDKTKLAKLYQEVSRGRDPVQVQRELGFSDPKKLEPFIAKAREGMTTKQRKKLDDAKEDIKTLDDLSSVLNRIFKESGSEMDEGYMTFSFGGKEHHYCKIDKETNDKLKDIKSACEDTDIPMRDFLQSMIADASLPSPVNRVKKKRKLKRAK